MTNLSIIIVSWNTQDLLNACLASIFQFQPAFPLQVIVVDNDSGDGSPEMVQRHFPAVCLLKNTVNLGFAAANNQGARAAAGRFLLFMNPDTQVHPGTLAGAVAFMEQHSEAGVMGCRTVNPNGSLQATAFDFPDKLRIFAYVAGLNRFFKISRFTDHSDLRNPDYVQGSFLIIKKELYDACGGFDERFFLYAEEVDLCMRVRAEGFKVYYYPDISITHYGGGSGRNSLVGLGHFIKSHIGLYQKYRPLREEQKLRRVLRSALRLRYFLELVVSPLHFRKRNRSIKKLLRDLPVTAAEKAGEHEL
jgi:GT2 family glycosyltransferase